MPGARVRSSTLLEACAPHAEALDCVDELDACEEIAAHTGAERQIELAARPGAAARAWSRRWPDAFAR